MYVVFFLLQLNDTLFAYRILALGAATLLVIALADAPYGYYTFLRIVVCGVGAWGALKAHADDRGRWTFALLGVAVLFNPIIPIHFDRGTWAIIDVVAAGIMGGSVFALNEAKAGAVEK